MSKDIFVVIEHVKGQVSDISYVMLAGARDFSQTSGGGDVVAVLLGQNAQNLAASLAADRVLYLEHSALLEFTSDAYQIALAGLIKEQSPRAVLLGHSSIGMDIAGGLSVKLGLPVINSCMTLNNGKFISQICGGKIMVEGELPGPAAVITMIPGGYKSESGQGKQSPPVTSIAVPALDGLRVNLKKYIEPDAGDVDISKEPILVSIGRGIQTKDNIELAQNLAAALGGQVCASRPVVDQAWLPTTRLVGKSGKRVKPKVYFALGISGAPEHVEGMSESDVIIAVNTDVNAPIFNVAKYGITTDMFDLLPVLTDKVKQAK